VPGTTGGHALCVVPRRIHQLRFQRLLAVTFLALVVVLAVARIVAAARVT
jgi:hypothetical protein